MKKSNREHIDEMFKQASDQEIDNMINQYPTIEELEEAYEFSDNHNKKMKRILKQANRAESNSYDEAWKKFGIFSFRAAAIICMLFTVLTLVAFTVPEIRVRITNYIVEKTDEYTSIDTESYFENNEVIEGAPEFTPDGYEIYNIIDTDISLLIEYNNPLGKIITFSRFTGDIALIIDSEDNEFSEIKIKNLKGYLCEQDNKNIIIFFYDNFTYRIKSEASLEDTILIAESLIK